MERFYRLAGTELSPLTPVTVEEIPEPYRHLLAHQGSMTLRLENFHKETLEIILLRRFIEGEHLHRSVMLTTEAGLPVELGMITIFLDRIPDCAAQRVHACKIPLGRILHEAGIVFRSETLFFFQVASNPCLNKLFGLEKSQVLYGRRNSLKALDGNSLAEVMEILPPLHSAMQQNVKPIEAAS